jgi:uncharacterized protein
MESNNVNYGKFQDAIDYVQSCLDTDGFMHTCRVLNYALQILDTEKKADTDVVILSAILHDIGRATGNSTNHANTGSEKSYAYLVGKGYTDEVAKHVADCIMTHCKCSETSPQTLEAKILFDADKLDTTGAIGTALAIVQCRQDGEPMYTLEENGTPLVGEKEETDSLMKKYRQKLRRLEKVFFTKKAKKIAAKHQLTMDEYFEEFIEEIESNHKKGSKLVQKYCN